MVFFWSYCCLLLTTSNFGNLQKSNQKIASSLGGMQKLKEKNANIKPLYFGLVPSMIKIIIKN